MNYDEFLERIINDGIKAVLEDYVKDTDKEKREGSIAGFEACRGKNPQQLVEEYKKATQLQQEAYILHVENYWWFRCFTLEVEWVINVVSAGLKVELLSHLPTIRGVCKAAEILGVQKNE